jgi:hypothetical protein
MQPVLSALQYDLLAADIRDPLNDGVLGLWIANNDDQLIAEWYNVIVPGVWAWRTSLSKAEIVGQVSPAGTSWDWMAYIARSAAERDGWREMFQVGRFGSTEVVNPSLANIRQGMGDVFSGPSGAAQRAHLLAMGRREMTRVEQLFAVGLGTAVSPSTMASEGPLTYLEVARALRNVGA